MKVSEIKNQLIAVQNVLNTITLSGIQNMGKLAGCARVIQDIVEGIPDPEPPKSDSAED